MKQLLLFVFVVVLAVALYVLFTPKRHILTNEWVLKVPGKAHIEGFKDPESCHYYFDTHFDEKKDSHRCVAVLRSK